MKKRSTAGKKIIGKNEMPTPTQPVSKAAFKRFGTGVVSHGVVSEVREHQDGKTMHVTIRHGKTHKDGLFSSYEDSTRLRVPKTVAKQFHMGKRVKVHVHPVGGK